jgi:uncharacterized protein YeaO (DUF488 family)
MTKRIVSVKRVYAEQGPGDGKRVLVDRLWPRGLSKEKAHIDLWLKEIAPSNDLRRWFAHDPEKFTEFQRRYESELSSGLAHEKLQELRDLVTKERVTLLFAAKDTEHNNAVVLRELLIGG